MDDLALGEGQAKGHVAIFAARTDDAMVGHTCFGLDRLTNRKKSELVHLSSLKKRGLKQADVAKRLIEGCPRDVAPAAPNPTAAAGYHSDTFASRSSPHSVRMFSLVWVQAICIIELSFISTVALSHHRLPNARGSPGTMPNRISGYVASAA
jgi:hypothetical protein